MNAVRQIAERTLMVYVDYVESSNQEVLLSSVVDTVPRVGEKVMFVKTSPDRHIEYCVSNITWWIGTDNFMKAWVSLKGI